MHQFEQEDDKSESMDGVERTDATWLFDSVRGAPHLAASNPFQIIEKVPVHYTGPATMFGENFSFCEPECEYECECASRVKEFLLLAW